jgi:hypothetical protein
MASVADRLLREGLAALARMLPHGYSVAPSSLARPSPRGDTWIIIRGQAKQSALCLVVARHRIEPRDMGPIAAHLAGRRNPALLVSPYLSPPVRRRLRGFGIGCWDLAGNMQIAIGDIDLCVEYNATSRPSQSAERGTRSLCGEMAGRVARALIDLRPPISLASLAEEARVEPGYAARVVAHLGESGVLVHKPRKTIEKVDWRKILRRWSLDSPFESRGEIATFLAGRGLPDLLVRLGASGFLHAITGELAFADLASEPRPNKLVMYVDDATAAVNQFGFHPAEDGSNVMLVKPVERSVFHRSYERDRLRYVSPSVMAADLAHTPNFERVLAWMAKHESAWRA